MFLICSCTHAMDSPIRKINSLITNNFYAISMLVRHTRPCAASCIISIIKQTAKRECGTWARTIHNSAVIIAMNNNYMELL